MSVDGRLVWVVNPGANTVSVISTKTNTVIKTINVGTEPQGVAVDPTNKYAFVANAAASTVSVIKITNANPKKFKAKVDKTLLTGAEPWNIIVSPDGRRAFVANSSQDTVSVIDATQHVATTRSHGKTRRTLVGPSIIGHVPLRGGPCDPNADLHFQPRGLAVTQDSKKLFVTSFLAFTKPGGRQGSDTGKQGLVCRMSINTKSRGIGGYRPVGDVTLAPENTGFTIDSDGDGTPDPVFAFPNQLQSIVIRGNQAFLPNIGASPQGPQRFDTTTEAFLNVIDGVTGGSPADSPGKYLNLHLGARVPEPGKKKLFFANPWAIAFTTQKGSGSAYVVSAAADLLVKVNVDGNGQPSFTAGPSTTRYIDLNDPANPATSGDNAGKNPQGIVINRQGTIAYVENFVSRNVSVVDLRNDRVIKTIRTALLPAPGSPQEVVLVGAEIFFSSRGNFNRPPGTTVSTNERLSQAGWQACSSCHFKGLTDGVVWAFATGPRKSIPLNATFNPHDKSQQRILNYSAIFDEVDDFELNIRNVSGPGPLTTPLPCSNPPPATSAFDPAHGLLVGDNGNVNQAPCVINSLPAKANANRPQLTVTLPGSTTAVPALTALREWVRAAVRSPNPPLTTKGMPGRLDPTAVSQGRNLFNQQGCQSCHLGSLFTVGVKDFVSPPAASDIATAVSPPPLFGNPVSNPFLPRFLRNIGSFNLGVPGQGNPLGNNIGADEKAAAVLNAAGVSQPPQDALGRDYNGSGKGNGYNVPSLISIDAVPPYYHNGACETLACVVGNVKHRTANGTLPDKLASAQDQAKVVAFLRSIH